MAVQLTDASANPISADPTQKALRISHRPVEALNWTNVGVVSGLLTGVAANGPVFSMRNGGTNIWLIRRITVGFITTTAFTAAQGLAYQIFKATGYTVADTGGTASAIFTGGGQAGQNKMRTSLTTMLTNGDLRIAAAAALTAGTRTLDTSALGIVGGTSSAVGSSLQPTVLLGSEPGSYPLVLVQNEGLVIQNNFLMGAVGVINLHVNVEFAEVTAY